MISCCAYTYSLAIKRSHVQGFYISRTQSLGRRGEGGRKGGGGGAKIKSRYRTWLVEKGMQALF